MAANNALLVTDINFDSIKSNLIQYLSSQNEFKDYDFEASGMQTIISLLAYNTYYNSIYTNFVANEMFLDTALIRNNVVSRAKMLGYTPSSARGARANLRVRIEPGDSPQTIVIPSNTVFSSTIDGIRYRFATYDSTTIRPDANSNYIATVTVREGDPVQETYTVNSNAPVRYILNNENCDTETLRVTVQQSTSNTSTLQYRQADDITAVTSNSNIYFLQEDNDGTFEVLFGDGVIGKNLTDGNIVKLNYSVCNGPVTNGTNTFNGPTSIDGYTNYSFTVSSRASGGANPQSINSIKFNAPRNYATQNRAVTTEDYRSIIINEAPDIQALSVWGGEQNKPAVYGKVFVCAKPFVGNTLTDLRKLELGELLKERNALTVEPEFVDPTYIYVVPTIEVTYNSNKTAKTPPTLLQQVDSALGSFQLDNLGLFDRTFYNSQLVEKLVGIDDSVVSVALDTLMQKRFIPLTNVPTTYQLQFNNPIYNPHAGHRYALSSSAFTLDGFTVYLDDNGAGNIRAYRIVESKRVTVRESVGTISYAQGLVTLNSLKITGYQGDGIKITVDPDKSNVVAVRNQLILLADASISIRDLKTDKIVISSVSVVSTTQTTSPSDVGLNTNSVLY